MLRRKRLPAVLRDAHRSFSAVMEDVDRAHVVLTEAAPSPRFAGRPLADALLEFEEALHAAQAGMEAWRAPELEAEWERCADGLATSLVLTERLRLEAPEIAGFETLIGTIDSLIAPLDAFVAAEERFRSFRR